MEAVKHILLNTTSILLALLLFFFIIGLTVKPGGCACGGNGTAMQPAQAQPVATVQNYSLPVWS